MAKAKIAEQPALFAEPVKADLKIGDTISTPKGSGKVVAQAKAKPAGKSEVVKFEPPKPTNLLAAIIQAAADPACQPEKMHALLDARDRLMRQEAHVAFMAAYIDMQDELPVIDAKGRIEIEAKREGRKKQDTRYATYQEINRVTKPILKKHRFGMLMLPDVGANGVGVLMRGQLAYVCETQYGKMVHAEHCAIAAPLETGGSKNNVQGVGSSLSYTKRYTAIALLNLVSEAPEDRDDDGKTATGKKPAPAGPTEITDQQVRELDAAITDCGVSLDVFLKKFEITGLPGLHPSLFDEAMAACKRFKESKSAKK